MLSKILSGCVVGLDGILIEVEVDVAEKGFPTFTIVGLPDKSVDEAKDRVRTAIVNTGFEMPDSRITVNLAPADIPKEGSAFDLPIAIGILVSSKLILADSIQNSLFIGELSLKGDIRPVAGIISILMMAQEKHISTIYLPFDNVEEARFFDKITIFPIKKLSDLILYLNKHTVLLPLTPQKVEFKKDEVFDSDFCDIKGQELVKRALEIAAAGFHNTHLKGPPGAGKTLISRAFPSILPPMDMNELLDVWRIYSVIGLLHKKSFTNIRPFRSPHHTASRIGLIGGGGNPRPGEISLAHRGVLFLDEFPEFPRSVLEALRQPLEDGFVTVSRAMGSITFPSRFLLLAASNPCPCGYLGHPKKPCSCMPGIILRYRKRLSGPLLDRIDLHVDVPSVQEDKLTDKNLGERSCKVRERVMIARERQKKRLHHTEILTNGEMSSKLIRQCCNLNDDADQILKQAIDRFSLSARSYFKIIKIAQTIADLAGKDRIERSHITESLQFRLHEE
ncbi:MAG: YifB family Mg chelatase-like AAA ATPase [bacterium]|nr:YifB family Mg chelatase-like AAA ATPase [bacterium]